MLPLLLLGFSIATQDLMAGRREDGLTFIFELIMLELLSASPQPLTAALHPHWPSPCLLAVLQVARYYSCKLSSALRRVKPPSCQTELGLVSLHTRIRVSWEQAWWSHTTEKK